MQVTARILINRPDGSEMWRMVQLTVDQSLSAGAIWDAAFVAGQRMIAGDSEYDGEVGDVVVETVIP